MSQHQSPRYDVIFPLVPILSVVGAFIFIAGWLIATNTQANQNANPEQVVVVVTATPVVEVAVAYSPESVENGRMIYQTTCSACHGQDARGVAGLGKTLIGSEYVHGLSDEELTEFIVVGRPIWDPLNTTGIAMPAKGGNMMLTDEQIGTVVAYIRTVDSEAMEIAAAPAEPETTKPIELAPFEPLAVVLLGDTREVYQRESLSGEATYNWACANCHGIDGTGTADWAGLLESDLLGDDNVDAFRTFINRSELISPLDAFPHPVYSDAMLNDEEVTSLINYINSLQ